MNIEVSSPLSFLMFGTVLGLSAGISPGPLLTLVLARSVSHGAWEGAKVAVGPLLTDAPIALAAAFVLVRASRAEVWLAGLSVVGGLFLAWVALSGLRANELVADGADSQPRSLLQGALVNALNPHPYIFWLTVGVPTVLRGRDVGWFGPILFLVVFMSGLVGGKIVLAAIAGRSRHLLRGAVYLWVRRLLAVALLFFAFLLLRDGGCKLSAEFFGSGLGFCP